MGSAVNGGWENYMAGEYICTSQFFFNNLHKNGNFSLTFLLTG